MIMIMIMIMYKVNVDKVHPDEVHIIPICMIVLNWVLSEQACKPNLKVYLSPKNIFWYVKGTHFRSPLHQQSEYKVHQVMK